MHYIVKLTEEQYNHIILCVETCHRIACGDIDEINQILPKHLDKSISREIKKNVFPELSEGETYKWSGGYKNGAHGEKFREEFDRFQAQGYQIYRQMCYKQNIAKGINNVLSTPTLTTDKAKQPIIEVIKDEDNNF